MADPTVTVSAAAIGSAAGALVIYLVQHLRGGNAAPQNGVKAALTEARAIADRAHARLDGLPCGAHNASLTGLQHDYAALSDVVREVRATVQRVEAKLDGLILRGDH